MKNSMACLCLVFLSGAVLSSAQVATPINANPPVELKGRIEKVSIAPGQGMPFVEMRSKEGMLKIVLGSMRYLMQQDFSPRAGDEIVVKGYKVGDQVVAASVTLPATGKAIRLRDEDGRPLWMGGREGRRGQKGPGGGRHREGTGKQNP